MADHKLNVDEGAEAKDTPGTPVVAHMVRVRVLAEAGIFKNGKQYDEGEEAVITSQAAERFAELDEVEILGDVEPEAEDEAADE